MTTRGSAAKKAEIEFTDDASRRFLREVWPVLLDVSKAGDSGNHVQMVDSLVAVRTLATETLAALGSYGREA